MHHVGRWDFLVALLIAFAVAISVIKSHRQPFLEPFYSPEAVRVFDSIADGGSAVALKGVVVMAIVWTILARLRRLWFIKEACMRELIDRYLIIAMALAETCRGIRDVRHFIRIRKAEDSFGNGKFSGERRPRWHSRWIMCAVVGGLAVVPVLYYGEHAVPWLTVGNFVS